ncbi:MAG: PAS domain S-box protein [Nitrospiraceae bacterium]|nr:MAG: PAS domain S-box protein [Nitrospiraceae bacterium]
MAKPKILIVEDEWIIANDLKTSLTQLGYIVPAIAATGIEAIEYVKTKKINLVLMDIVLQGEKDGIETAREIISEGDIPVIFLTAYTDDAIMKQAKKSGAYGYLVKPFRDREMQATIELALYKHEMENRLKASENHLYTTLVSINDAVISTDKTGSIIFMNPLAESLTGWKLESARKKGLEDIFDIRTEKKGRENVNPVSAIIREGLTITQANYVLCPHQGKDISIELSSAPIRNGKGNVNGAVIVFRDVSRRIQTEKELDEYRKQLEQITEERTAKLKLFSEIAEKSPDGIQILDLDGSIFYSNHAVEEICGFSHEELAGQIIQEITFDPEFANNEIMPGINKNGRWDGELLLKHKKGKVITVWLAAFIVNDQNDQPMGIISIIRDLTERRMAEDALKESETKFRTLFNQASDSIFLLSFATEGLIIEDTNDAAVTMHGYSREEMIGKPISFLDDPDTKKHVQERKRRVQKGETLSFEGRHVRKDGTTFPVDVSAQLICIGEKRYVLAIDRDITERKQVEENLLKHQEQLEELVKERARELLEANKNLKLEVNVRKTAERKLLDYQKQLQLLTSQLSLIEENEKRRIATELHDCIGQTLALSKIKLGLLNRAAPSEDLRKSIKEILHLIEQTIKETRTLTFELSPPILYELGLGQAIKWLIDQFREKHGLDVELIDDGQDKPFSNNTRFFIFQAIRELLVNIVKHAQATKASIIMKRDDGLLRIIIEDDGIGFSKPSLNYDGYGLFNIRERMNHINGRFEIKTVSGRGTRVTLVAPLMIDNKLIKRS